VAAVEALALRDLLAGPAAEDDLAPRFFREAARIIDVPWGIAGGSDLRLPGAPGPVPRKVRVINAYVAPLQAAAAVDPVVGLAFCASPTPSICRRSGSAPRWCCGCCAPDGQPSPRPGPAPRR
jgi:hypothetical protein